MDLYIVFEIRQEQEVIGGHIGTIPESHLRIHRRPFPIATVMADNEEEACTRAAQENRTLGEFAVVRARLMAIDFSARETQQFRQLEE